MTPRSGLDQPSRPDRSAVLAATDLAELADELLGERRGSARSPKWACPRPDHAQTGASPPVSVYRTRSGEQRWHCFGCGAGGSAVDLLVEAAGLTVAEAFSALARRGGLGEGEPPRLPAPRPRPTPDPPAPDPAALAAYAEACAAQLARPLGSAVRAWLTEERGLPAEVLEANRVGADPGRARQSRPEGIPRIRSHAAVFPVIDAGHIRFVQLRLLCPGDTMPAYLNAASSLAENPKVARYRPLGPGRGPVVVAEGPIDGLSAAAAGYEACAVLGVDAAEVDAVARCLGTRDRAVAVAMDADPAGRRSAAHLLEGLSARGFCVAEVAVPEALGDLNDWMRASPDWPNDLGAALDQALARPSPRIERGTALGR